MRMFVLSLFLVSCNKDAYTQDKTLTQIPFWVPCQVVVLLDTPATKREETLRCTHVDYCVECGIALSGTYTCGPGLYLDCPGKQLTLIEEHTSILQCNYMYRGIQYHSAPWSETHTNKQALENCH